MTKASTLVNEDVPQDEVEKSKDGLEERLDSMLEELKGEIRGAERLVGENKGIDEEKRRESVDSWDVGDEEGYVATSRRTSDFTAETRDAPTEESASRRESALSHGTHDDFTEDSASRRDSALSSASFESDRRRPYHPEGSPSRRDSVLSSASFQSDRRQSYHTETADDSILSHNVEDSVHDESTVDDGTQASRSTYEDSFLDDEQTENTASRRESDVEQDPIKRRASKRTEALIQAAARGIVEQIERSAQSSRMGERTEDGASARSSAAHESVAAEEEEAQPQVSSARPSDAHESVAPEEPEQTQSKASSARPSEAHESVAQEKSARSSAAHESVAPEEPEQAQSKVSSARPSEAHESVAAEEASGSKAPSARPSEAHESVASEEEVAPATPSARVSEAHEPVAAEEEARSKAPSARPSDADALQSKQPSARPPEAHEPAATQDENLSRVPSVRPSEAHEAESGDNDKQPTVRDARPSELTDPGEAVIQSIEEDEQPVVIEEEAGTSSHNENDDDVFSDHSPRSSVGSLSGEDHHQRKLSHEKVTQRSSARSLRMSDFSHYETDDQEEAYIPTVRGTPRPPFRSPSSVKAMQMSSPPASVIGSSRSSRRTPLPTVSRLGSPSAQYSPKKTPPRFKRNTPPLVLLHVTLLPLRWPWGDVIDVAQMDELSEGGKGLREAWRQLQERMGDTTCERGILLPHPQNDFEVLEERLLEALELPLRRRARILECGHYLGPSNDLTMLEDSESEDEDYYYHESPRQSRSSANKETHWCGTCHSEIRYESLGLGKVFRVKVYASNGLIKAGAWDACWKEMERVDVEIEPIVETEVHEELVALDNEQQRALELHQEAEAQRMEEEEAAYAGEPYAEEEEATQLHHDIHPSSPPEIAVTSEPEPPSAGEERRLRDEARLREIYGETPPAASEPTPAEQPPSSEYVHHQTPPSPSAEAYARREERRQSSRNDSLPELILEAVKVMMQDKKNVIIALMSVLVLALALRTGGIAQPAELQPIVKQEPPAITVTERAQEAVSSVAEILESVAPTAAQASASEGVDPCSTASSQGYQRGIAEQETVVSERIVTVVETMTETSYETATVTASQVEETLAHVEEDIVQPQAAKAEGFESDEVVADFAESDSSVEEEVVLDEVVEEL